MKMNEILSVIRSLARSQGLYGRILKAIEDLRDYGDPDKYDELVSALEAQNFTDPVDVVLYFEA